MHDIAPHSYSLRNARLRGDDRADLYVAANRKKGTVGAVQGSLRETCGSHILVNWEAKIIRSNAPVTGKGEAAHFKYFLAAAASGAARWRM